MGIAVVRFTPLKTHILQQQVTLPFHIIVVHPVDGNNNSNQENTKNI
jgi:hypothetical protein